MSATPDPAPHPLRTRWIAGAAVATPLAVLAWGLYPGYASFDTLSQLAQARGAIDDVAAPGMVLLFRATAAHFHDTGFAFIFGLLMIVWATVVVLRQPGVPRLAVALALGALLPLWLLLPQAWSDIHMLACLAAAVAIALRAPRDAQGRLGWMAVLAILALVGWATWVRHNAILAVLPLLGLLPAGPRGLRSRALAAGALVVALLLLRAASGMVVDVQRSVWALIPMWDLQALSIRRGEVLLPPGFVGPGMDVEQLRGAFSPYSAAPLFAGTRSGVRNPTIERLDAQQAQVLRRAWLDAVAAAPTDWLAHRATVLRGLLGTHRTGDLAAMVDVPQFPPGARRSAGQERVHACWRGFAERAKAVGVASALWPLLAGSLLLAVGWRRQRGLAWPVVLLAASALLYAAAYAVIAPSSELRYLAWPMWAWCMAGCLALGGRAAMREVGATP